MNLDNPIPSDDGPSRCPKCGRTFDIDDGNICAKCLMPSDEELNIAICEWRGWRDCHYSLASVIDDDPFSSRKFIGIPPSGVTHKKLPSHITGIEALGNMHEAEKGLNPEQLNQYRHSLSDVCGGYTVAVSATARQRAIALLRVVKPEIFT